MQQKWLRRSSVFGQAKNSLASSALRPGKTLKPQVVGRFVKTTVTSIFNENTWQLHQRSVSIKNVDSRQNRSNEHQMQTKLRSNLEVCHMTHLTSSKKSLRYSAPISTKKLWMPRFLKSANPGLMSPLLRSNSLTLMPWLCNNSINWWASKEPKKWKIIYILALVSTTVVQQHTVGGIRLMATSCVCCFYFFTVGSKSKNACIYDFISLLLLLLPLCKFFANNPAAHLEKLATHEYYYGH